MVVLGIQVLCWGWATGLMLEMLKYSSHRMKFLTSNINNVLLNTPVSKPTNAKSLIARKRSAIGPPTLGCLNIVCLCPFVGCARGHVGVGEMGWGCGGGAGKFRRMD